MYPDWQCILFSLRIEPFAALFWALSIALALILKQLTQPAGLASLNSGAGTVLYGRDQLGSILLKACWLPAFSDLAILFIYMFHHPSVTVLYGPQLPQ